MTVKTDMYDRLVMRFSNTLLMDTQTGTPVSETDIAAGDKVFVYYADYVMETEPVSYTHLKDDSFGAMQRIYENVRDAAYSIIEGKGATYYGIGMRCV